MIAAVDSATIFTLIGVIVGAAIGGASQVLLRRREERFDLRVAARLLSDDLIAAKSRIKIAHEDAKAPFPGLEPRLGESWPEHRVTLSRHLRPDQWDAVVAAVFSIEMFEMLARLDGQHTVVTRGDTTMKSIDAAVKALIRWTI